MKVFIGVPTHHGQVWAEHTRSIAWAVAFLTANQVGFEYYAFSWYDVAQQRDRIAKEFLRSDATHLLFVDSDISFKADLPLRLLKSGRPLVGAICPRRIQEPERAQAWVGKGYSVREALSFSHRLAFSAQKLAVNDGYASVDAIGAGFMLIARECFEKIDAHFKPRKYRLSSGNEVLTEFFPWGRDEEEVYPEDWGFCRKWREIGGDVHAYVDAEVGHFGHAAFYTNLRKTIEAAVKHPDLQGAIT